MNRHATKCKGLQRKHHYTLIGVKHDNNLQRIPTINHSLLLPFVVPSGRLSSQSTFLKIDSYVFAKKNA